MEAKIKAWIRDSRAIITYLEDEIEQSQVDSNDIIMMFLMNKLQDEIKHRDFLIGCLK